MRIAVIGGGATGALAAVHIARALGAAAADIAVIEPNAELGRGLAFSTPDPRHLINVRIGAMSAFADQPDHFVNWLKRRQPEASAFGFVPRHVYGDYVSALAADALAAGAIRHIRETCVDLIERPTHATLWLASGRTLDVDRVVLATGHDAKPAIGGIPAEAPWGPDSLDGLSVQAPVLIVGAGLTMVDMALSLDRRGHRGPILAVSRHGRVPQPHRPLDPIAVPESDVPFGADLSRLTRWLRDLAARTVAEGGDWRQVVDGLRPHTQRLWLAMSVEKKRRFLRHARAYWDTHRHRMAPEIAAEFAAMRASGRLTVIAGRILTAERSDKGVKVTIRKRGDAGFVKGVFARIVDCTGLADDIRQARNPLIRAMLTRGALRGDPLDLGLDVAEDFSVRGATGEPSARIKTIGPLARATFWECTAIPDIRCQCLQLAQELAKEARALTPERS